jgi:CDGSH-type Zn-finger protein
MSGVVEIVVRDNGPIRISGGPFVIKDAQGNVFDLGGKPMVSLCRCGESAKKPFCDGAHKTCGFDSVVLASEGA